MYVISVRDDAVEWFYQWLGMHTALRHPDNSAISAAIWNVTWYEDAFQLSFKV